MAAYVRNRLRRPLSIWKPRTKSSVLRSYKWTWRSGYVIAVIGRKCLKLQSKQMYLPLEGTAAETADAEAGATFEEWEDDDELY